MPPLNLCVSICLVLVLNLLPAVSSNRLIHRSQRNRRMDTSHLASAIRQEIVPTLSGCLVFATTLGLSTCAQKVVGISTGTKVLARMAGIPTVCIASLLSQRCTLLAQEWTQNPESIKDRKIVWEILAKPSSKDECYEITGRLRVPKRDVHMYVQQVL